MRIRPTKPNISIIIILIFHAVGFVGFYIPVLQGYFMMLVPFHLLLMAGIIIINHRNKGRRFWTFFIVTALAGYLIELLGTKTGLIFGNYNYGQTLGYQLFGVPLIIGINWVILIYSVGYIMKLTQLESIVLKAFFGALMLVLLDICLEHVAMYFDYWTWEFYLIPVQNYLGWFMFSFFMLLFFFSFKFKSKQQGIVAIALYFTQLAFFLALNLMVV